MAGRKQDECIDEAVCTVDGVKLKTQWNENLTVFLWLWECCEPDASPSQVSMGQKVVSSNQTII